MSSVDVLRGQDGNHPRSFTGPRLVWHLIQQMRTEALVDMKPQNWSVLDQHEWVASRVLCKSWERVTGPVMVYPVKD